MKHQFSEFWRKNQKSFFATELQSIRLSMVLVGCAANFFLSLLPLSVIASAAPATSMEAMDSKDMHNYISIDVIDRVSARDIILSSSIDVNADLLSIQHHIVSTSVCPLSFVKKKAPFPLRSLTFTATECTLRGQDLRRSLLTIERQDILGAALLSRDSTSTVASWQIFTCVKKQRSKKRKLISHVFQLKTRSSGALALAQAWVDAINTTIYQKKQKRTFKVFINPAGGSGKGEKIYSSIVRPFFDQCNVECDVTLTSSSNQAMEETQALDLDKYETIVVVGGDGFVAEVIQGLLRRGDSARAIRHPIGVSKSKLVG